MKQKIYSKDKPLTFPIIIKSSRKTSLSQGIMMAIVGFLLLFFIIFKTYYRYDISADSRSAILFVVLIIVVFIVNYLLHKVKYGGEFTITDKEIILNSTNKTARFPINELNNLKITCPSFEKGKNLISRIKRWFSGKTDGKGNSIEFIYKGDFHILEIYLRGKEEVESFIQRAKDLNAIYN